MSDIEISRILRGFLLYIGLVYPIRIVAGLSISCILYIIVISMIEHFPNVSLLRAINDHEIIFILSFSVLLSFGGILFKPRLLSDSIGSNIDTIDEIFKRANLSKLQKDMLWKRLAERIIESTRVENMNDPKVLKTEAEKTIEENPRSDEDFTSSF